MPIDVQVGQTVMVTAGGGRSGVHEETVTRIARKYFYTSGPYGRNEERYSLEDGMQPGQYSMPCAYTVGEWKEREHRSQLVTRLRELGFSHPPHKLSTDAISQIVAIAKADLSGAEKVG